MSGCLVGDYSQKEVLPLGPLSAHKYQRYALIFLNISPALRRKLTFSDSQLMPGTVLGIFIYHILTQSLAQVSALLTCPPLLAVLEVNVIVALYSKHAQRSTILPLVILKTNLLPLHYIALHPEISVPA